MLPHYGLSPNELSTFFDPEFGMPFYYQTKKIFSKLWDVIKNTSDNIITGLVCSKIEYLEEKFVILYYHFHNFKKTNMT